MGSMYVLRGKLMRHQPTEDSDEDLMFIEGDIVRKERNWQEQGEDFGPQYVEEEYYRSGKPKVSSFLKKVGMDEKKARMKAISLKKIGKRTIKFGKKARKTGIKVGKKGVKVTKKSVRKTKKKVKKK